MSQDDLYRAAALHGPPQAWTDLEGTILHANPSMQLLIKEEYPEIQKPTEVEGGLRFRDFTDLGETFAFPLERIVEEAAQIRALSTTALGPREAIWQGNGRSTYFFAEAVAPPEEDSVSLFLYDATHTTVDPLTKLHNRHYFQTELGRHINSNGQTNRTIGYVLMLDLVGFKTINDTDPNKHLAGDRVLQAVAQVIDEQTTDAYLAARYGGDEFAVLLDEASLAETKSIEADIAQAINTLQVEGVTIPDEFGIRIGRARYKRRDNPITAITLADNAMYLDRGPSQR